MMRRGKIVDRGTPEALIARYGRQNLEQVFLDIARERGGPRDGAGPESPGARQEPIGADPALDAPAGSSGERTAR